MFRSQKAFTLVELLIVIVIIGILAVALVPRLTGGPQKARDAQRKADLQQLATALEFYADDQGGTYPTAAEVVCVSTLALDSYFTSVPSDPLGASNPLDIASEDCADDYGYRSTDDGYVLIANLENLVGTGTGVYDIDSFSFAPTGDGSTSSVLSGNALCGAGGTDCPNNGAVYVVGR